jgi:hypothetical protein
LRKWLYIIHLAYLPAFIHRTRKPLRLLDFSRKEKSYRPLSYFQSDFTAQAVNRKRWTRKSMLSWLRPCRGFRGDHRSWDGPPKDYLIDLRDRGFANLLLFVGGLQ